jgi:hypothetical protein
VNFLQPDSERELLIAVLAARGWTVVEGDGNVTALAPATGPRLRLVVGLDRRYGMLCEDGAWTMKFDADLPNRVIFGAIVAATRATASGEPVAP